MAVKSASVVVIGQVTAIDSEGDGRGATMQLEPEAYLKGPTQGHDLHFARGVAMPCQYAELQEGQRVLLMATGLEPFSWPAPESAYLLEGGNARSFNPADPRVQEESTLIQKIRDATGQYTVPAASNDDGAGIDWLKTVLPVGGALIVILAVSLALLRIWHRVETS